MSVAKRFSKAIQQMSEKGTSSYDSEATVTRVDGDTLWVHITGGVAETPVKRTVSASVGDTVQVRVGGGRAWVTGNASSPPTDDTTANVAQATAITAQETADSASQMAELATSYANTARQSAVEAAEAADSAQTSAETAAEAANEAVTTASAAQESATQAASAAATAQESADTAQATADSALASASAAQTAASNAETAASAAQVSAASASIASASASRTAALAQAALDTIGDYEWAFEAVESPTGNPSTSGYWEKSGDGESAIYSKSTDTEVDESKTYYQLAEGNKYFYKDSEGAHIINGSDSGYRNDLDDEGMHITDISTGVTVADFEADGMTVKESGGTEIAHLGYGEGNASSGTAYAPYYTIGKRYAGSGIGNYSTAEGFNTTASGAYAHAEGYATTASGFAAHAEGDDTIASIVCSHAEGYGTKASGIYSHAEGYRTTASGDYSHAEGDFATASGDYSHVEGDITTASGEMSHAEGYGTKASGERSHAEGSGTTASGDYSHAGGQGTRADQNNQTAIGKYNTESNTGNLFVVGIGTSSSARADGFTVDTSGNIAAAGTVTDGDGNVLSAQNCYFGTCSTAAATAAKEVTVSDQNFQLTVGATVRVKFTYTNTYSASSSGWITLNVNSTGAKQIYAYGSATAATGTNTTVYGRAGYINTYVYDGTYWVWQGSSADNNSTYTGLPDAYCSTAAATAAKVATSTNYKLASGNRFTLVLNAANTYAGALTLNVNNTGAKTLYINDAISSSTNYSLPAGTYSCWYDGTYYYLRTDGMIPGCYAPTTVGTEGYVLQGSDSDTPEWTALSDLFAITVATSSTAGTSVAADDWTAFYLSAQTKSGYKCLGVLSVSFVNGTSSGTGESKIHAFRYGIASSSGSSTPTTTPLSTAYPFVRCRNYATSTAAKVYAQFSLLWVKA